MTNEVITHHFVAINIMDHSDLFTTTKKSITSNRYVTGILINANTSLLEVKP
ncbi:MAG: hypothetical protein H2184_10245 [Candidatus Galacturonibacter soehngenii]|nr:hypothetical protein [Candidatus Galacturonibacter soehngenii]